MSKKKSTKSESLEDLTILNAGCGNYLVKGALNMDRTAHRPEVHVVHDMNQLPWPFPDERFDKVVARASLEHLDIDLLASINECWRILKPGGLLYVKVPYWNSPISYKDVTHRWRFDVSSFEQFDPRTAFGAQYSFYGVKPWHIVKGPKLNKAKSSIHVTMRKVPELTEAERAVAAKIAEAADRLSEEESRKLAVALDAAMDEAEKRWEEAKAEEEAEEENRE
jgi:SAM-dependent methyltransferase